MSLNEATRRVVEAELDGAEEGVSFYVTQRENAERSLEQISRDLRIATKRRDELKHSLEEES